LRPLEAAASAASRFRDGRERVDRGDGGALRICSYPAAAVRQGLLVAWYGPEGQPTVAIPPIDLATA